MGSLQQHLHIYQYPQALDPCRDEGSTRKPILQVSTSPGWPPNTEKGHMGHISAMGLAGTP